MATSREKPWTSKVTLNGLPPGIMFDRYLGDNTSKVANSEKMYKKADGTIYLPAINVISFLSAENTRSAAKALYDTRKYKDKAAALKSYTMITPEEIPLTEDGNPIMWQGDFDDKIVLLKHVARLPKGIPNPKERPVVRAPWSAEFEVTLFPNGQVKPDEFKWLVETGLMMIGLGTYRGVFGKATAEWHE